MKATHPEYVEEIGDKLMVKYPIPGHMLRAYRTLTSYNMHAAQTTSGSGDCVITKTSSSVASKKP